MFYVYAIKSLSNHKWYVGMTKNLRKRRNDHLAKRRDLYDAGHEWRILSEHESLDEAAEAEASAIQNMGTLHPGGNNLRVGGLTGLLLRSSKKEFIAQVGVYSQQTLDKMALTKLKKAGKTHCADLARRRTAWIRHDKGLEPLPGTEHYLLEPRHPHLHRPSPLIGVKKNEEHKRAMREAWDRRKREGRGNLHRIGVRYSEDVKENIAAGRIRGRITNGKPLTYANILAYSAAAKERARAGLKPLPGLELFVELKTGPQKGFYYTQKQRGEMRQKMINDVNDAVQTYARNAGWIK